MATRGQVLDRFFAVLSDCVHRFEGTVNQYTGDGIMALFGAPIAHEDHPQRACYAALHLQDALESEAREVMREFGVSLSARVGIHTGKAIVGNIGSKSRVNYTVVGDTVNVASRLEQLSKDFEIRDQCVVLVSKESRDSGAEALGEKSGITFSEIGDHNVRGRSKPVTVFRIYAAEK